MSTFDPAAGQTPAFRPFIPAVTGLRELSPLPLVVGVLLGVIFGASSLYLVLKVGLTVSASIPVAVISITLFRLLAKAGLAKANILEHNIVQTAGSAGESIAFGVGVTMPAILILGFDLEIMRVTLVAVLGALLGILMMIPLRRALIVHQHGVLKFPEGTACAEVLKASATAEDRAAAYREGDPIQTDDGTSTGARVVFIGFAVGVAYKLAMAAFKLWKDVPAMLFPPPLAGGSVAAEISPELLGVGYVIGPRIASIMVAGGALSHMVLIPAITFFGQASDAIIAPGAVPITEMTPGDIRSAYILYIGAGAVAAGGVISLVRALPIIVRSLRSSYSDIRGGTRTETRPRTDQDLPLKVVLIGIVALTGAILMARSLHMNALGAALIVVFGFLFVTVSARLTGEIGSSSNPLSGMTVATLLLTCLVFLALGWTGPTYYVTALSVGAIVCIAASNGGTTAQDLKTGFLVGGTPRAQQLAIICGALASAVLLGPILLALNNASTVYVPVTRGSPAAVLRAPAETIANLPHEKIKGPQASEDTGTYRVWHAADPAGGVVARYLVDEQGRPVYLVDPGINGVHRVRPDGTTVDKFDAPKATLMSYIIKGILNQQLPWTLVLLGVMIAIVLELCGINCLAFAVGLYLPISSSMPVFVGGAIRWLADRRIRKRADSTPAEITAESDKSPGVLVASGYIAGGAIAGIGIAFMAGMLGSFNRDLTALMSAFNPFFDGPYADLLSLLPFAAIALLLYLVGPSLRGNAKAIA